MSDENKKSAFSEKTVVQTRQSFAEQEAAMDAAQAVKTANNDKTVVFAQSNLQETFDARTVVRSSKPAPVKEAASLPAEAPASVSPAAKVVAAALPVSSEVTNPDVQIQTGTRSMPKDDAPKKPQSQTARREARKQLDRKTRTMVAGFATLCALVILCLVVAFGGPKTETTPEKTASATPRAGVPTQSTDLASQGESSPGPKAGGAPHAITDYQSMTDVLNKFDRAAQKAQQHAF